MMHMGGKEGKMVWAEGIEVGPVKPAFVIQIYSPGKVGLWTGDLSDTLGHQLASASAPSVWAVWDMLASVLGREVPGNLQEGES
jgi:hypothetical protein